MDFFSFQRTDTEKEEFAGKQETQKEKGLVKNDNICAHPLRMHSRTTKKHWKGACIDNTYSKA